MRYFLHSPFLSQPTLPSRSNIFAIQYSPQVFISQELRGAFTIEWHAIKAARKTSWLREKNIRPERRWRSKHELSTDVNEYNFILKKIFLPYFCSSHAIHHSRLLYTTNICWIRKFLSLTHSLSLLLLLLLLSFHPFSFSLLTEKKKYK